MHASESLSSVDQAVQSSFFEDFLLTTPNALQHQPLDAFTISFGKSFSCHPDLICPKTFHTQTSLDSFPRTHQIKIPALPAMQGIDHFFVPDPFTRVKKTWLHHFSVSLVLSPFRNSLILVEIYFHPECPTSPHHPKTLGKNRASFFRDHCSHGLK